MVQALYKKEVSGRHNQKAALNNVAMVNTDKWAATSRKGSRIFYHHAKAIKSLSRKISFADEDFFYCSFVANFNPTHKKEWVPVLSISTSRRLWRGLTLNWELLNYGDTEGSKLRINWNLTYKISWIFIHKIEII